MKITRENCEAWFLDYYEGRLEPHQAEVLFAFLDANPDLHEVFNSFESITLDDLTVSFEHKEELKRVHDLPRTINEINCEEIFIADAEGLLDAEMQQQLGLFLQQYPERRATYELFLKTRLQPEPVVFEEKSLLKKTAEEITADNCEQWFIASAEARLSAEEQKQLQAFLVLHPEKKQELAQYAKTILTPDMSVVYPDKAALKRKQRGAAFFPAWRAAAAIVVLLVGGYGISRMNSEEIVGQSLSLASAHSGRKATGKTTTPVNTDVQTNGSNVAKNNPPVNTNIPETANYTEWLAANSRPVQAVSSGNGNVYDFALPVDAQEGSMGYAAVTPKVDENEYPTISEIATNWVANRFELELQETAEPVATTKALQPSEADGWDWTSAIVKKVSRGNVLIRTRKNENGKRRFDVMAWKYRFSNDKNS